MLILKVSSGLFVFLLVLTYGTVCPLCSVIFILASQILTWVDFETENEGSPETDGICSCWGLSGGITILGPFPLKSPVKVFCFFFCHTAGMTLDHIPV